MVEIDFDPAKDAANIEKHGISLSRAADLVPLVFVEDDRFEAPRYRVYGFIDDVPHCLAATDPGGKVRVISLLRAPAQELRRYAAYTCRVRLCESRMGERGFRPRPPRRPASDPNHA